MMKRAALLSRRSAPTAAVRKTSFSSASSTALAIKQLDLFNPTEEHASLRGMLRQFVETEVDPQVSHPDPTWLAFSLITLTVDKALEYNKKEKFNVDLFRKLGSLGLLGITVDTDYGGSGMDATAAVIAHEELAASDPAFCLSYLAHSLLFVNNLAQNGRLKI